MATSIVGVDFGGGMLRAVELSDADKSRPTIERYNEMPLPEGAIVRGEVVEPNTVATALKRLWSTGGFTSKSIAIGVGNHKVLARDLTVPRMPLQRIRESLPFQVQEMLPMPVAEALLDFYPVAEIETEQGPQVQGLLVAAAKDAVMANIRAAKLAGLSTVEVDLIPFALSRVFLRDERGSGTVMLVEVGGGTTSVVIATNGVPQFLRIIPTGSVDLTQTLAARLEIPVEQAETFKRTIGLSSSPVEPQYQRALETVYELTGELLTSIRNTLTYFVNTRPAQQPSRILLSGGGAAVPGFDRVLQEFTRLPVHIADPFERFAVSRKLDEAEMRRQGPSAAVALGLAMAAAA
ncbi:type IV pilus assembly protein PilM [Leifsonia sp. Leaf264]|uniref:type IV pilus assembly protein PilM n=1 Tax=Leifsonia sp. Leaf264 TaxID=1736314 RepID=UPI0007008DA7|nr:type IV pilus assembly protein PilM [Leifsonia sp. Leaf264]KQO97395.1 pilus assembly protein PilM [Leifsonia sp. Leaf264]